ncbi:hypothetical protein [Pseudomonas putida]|uniref:Flagellar biosynthesis protein FlhF n=1 Tax=Pseudomonas putida TaxID=303 RepID=A0A8I1JI20_PSEPU|nr:hypothetical protein [Pseudomonas putida]MBI6882518.1 hypothetical protein [Pseudomonas putida]
MSVKRFTGSNIREIMQEIRAELGDDAAIISNRRVPGGHEVVAMSNVGLQNITEESHSSKPRTSQPEQQPAPAREITVKPVPKPAPAEGLSFDEQLALRSRVREMEKAAEVAPLPNPFSQPASPVRSEPPPVVTQHRKTVGKAAYATQASTPSRSAEFEPGEVTVKLSAPITEQPAAPVTKAIEEPVLEVFEAELVEDHVEPEPSAPVLPSAAERFAEDLRKARAITEWSSQMVGDLNSMQDLIRRQILPRVSQSTVYAEINQLLAKAGFQKDLCTQMLSSLPGELAERRMDRNGISRWIEHALVEQISVMGSPEVWWGGRTVVSMIGSNGVGKSTSIAKLAARFLMDNSASEVVILTTDVEQNDALRSHAELFGIDFQVVNDFEDLDAAIKSYGYKRLVLVDTPGHSFRSKKLSGSLARLAKVSGPMKVMLILNSSSEAESLEAMTGAYIAAAEKAGLTLSDCVVTKLDEAIRIGALISTMARHKLRLNYQSDGDGVLEDFERGSALALVRQSMECYSVGLEISAVDGTKDNGEQFDIMRATLLENVGEMTQILTSIRREFKNAGFVEATKFLSSATGSRRELPFGKMLEEQKGTEVVSKSGKPGLLWHTNDYPVESAYFNLSAGSSYSEKPQLLPNAGQKAIRSVN